MNNKVLVALSGGVDSAMTAWLLKKEGYDITGINFRFFDGDEGRDRLESIVRKLNIKLVTFDARAIFRNEVVNYFINHHLSGTTPSPCTQCNPNVKWKLLFDLANELGFRFYATGHYVRIEEVVGRKQVFRGLDKAKDQSYYLWGVPANYLKRALTPLGSLLKKEVITLARSEGFDFLTGTRGSSGLCFAARRDMKELLSAYFKELNIVTGEGSVLNREGEIIGTHDGYMFYTIGQKRGLRINNRQQDLCVVRIDADRNVLVADTWESLYVRSFIVHQLRFAYDEVTAISSPIQVMVRGFGLNPAGDCRLDRINPEEYRVILNKPAWAVAPGQPAVFYSGDQLLGGGLIAKETE